MLSVILPKFQMLYNVIKGTYAFCISDLMASPVSSVPISGSNPYSPHYFLGSTWTVPLLAKQLNSLYYVDKHYCMRMFENEWASHQENVAHVQMSLISLSLRATCNMLMYYTKKLCVLNYVLLELKRIMVCVCKSIIYNISFNTYFLFCYWNFMLIRTSMSP